MPAFHLGEDHALNCLLFMWHLKNSISMLEFLTFSAYTWKGSKNNFFTTTN